MRGGLLLLDDDWVSRLDTLGVFRREWDLCFSTGRIEESEGDDDRALVLTGEDGASGEEDATGKMSMEMGCDKARLKAGRESSGV